LAEITIGKRQTRGVSAYGLLKGVLPDYSMTKGGIHAFTRSLSNAAGAARNPRQRGGARTGLDVDKPSDKQAKAPMKRPAQPKEIAAA